MQDLYVVEKLLPEIFHCILDGSPPHRLVDCLECSRPLLSARLIHYCYAFLFHDAFVRDSDLVQLLRRFVASPEDPNDIFLQPIVWFQDGSMSADVVVGVGHTRSECFGVLNQVSNLGRRVPSGVELLSYHCGDLDQHKYVS